MLGTTSPRGVAAAIPRLTAALEHDLLRRLVPGRVQLRRPAQSQADRLGHDAAAARSAPPANSRRALSRSTQLHRRGDVAGEPLGHVRCGERRPHHGLGGGLADALDRHPVYLRDAERAGDRRDRGSPGTGRRAPDVCGRSLARRRPDSTSSLVITPPGPVPGQRAPGRPRDPWPACAPAAWPAPHRHCGTGRRRCRPRAGQWCADRPVGPWSAGSGSPAVAPARETGAADAEGLRRADRAAASRGRGRPAETCGAVRRLSDDRGP